MIFPIILLDKWKGNLCAASLVYLKYLGWLHIFLSNIGLFPRGRSGTRQKAWVMSFLLCDRKFTPLDKFERLIRMAYLQALTSLCQIMEVLKSAFYSHYFISFWYPQGLAVRCFSSFSYDFISAVVFLNTFLFSSIMYILMLSLWSICWQYKGSRDVKNYKIWVCEY